MSDFLLLTLYAAIGSIAGILGGALLVLNRNLSQILSKYAIALATGVFLALSFFELLPESQEMIGNTAFLVIGGICILAYMLEKLFFSMHHHEEEKTSLKKSSIPFVIFGDTIHNFIDGIAIGASFAVDPALGLFVAFASFLHETPHEIADFGILVASGWSRIKAFRTNFLSALATFPGAYLAYSFQNELVTGVLLAIATGIFFYVAATDFLPQFLKKDRKTLPAMLFVSFIGFITIYYVGQTFHPHLEEDSGTETYLENTENH